MMKPVHSTLAIGGTIAVLTLGLVDLMGQPTVSAQAPVPSWGFSGELHKFHVQGRVNLLVGAGANIAVTTGDEGVLYVDTGLEANAEKLLAFVKKELSNAPVRWIVNTSADLDHTGGNEVIAKAGSTTEGNPTPVAAHENVLTKMSLPGSGPARPTNAWPTTTYTMAQKDFFFNGDPVVMYHTKNAHTDGDSVVFFRRSDVVMTGDIYSTVQYPRFDSAAGGGVQGIIDGLNLVLDLAVPRHMQEGGTMIVPGHGRVADEADVLEYRDMVTIVRDRVEDLVKQGKTLDQVKAAKPTLDYDIQYGSTNSNWTTTNFVEAVYKDLASKAKGGSR
jgi:glyoxylase-like metal-dependent hydrolase (beta-lactamase superfamily II)